MTKAIPSSTAWRAGARFALRLGFRPRGRTGDHLGPGVGASLEFEDRRHYAPGDDLRHVDWRVMARTDDVLVRVHREEVQPRVDLVVDGSRSMAAEPEKAQALADFAAFFCAAAGSAGLALRLFVLDDEGTQLERGSLARHGVHFTGRTPLAPALARIAPRLSAGSLRVCVSDFLVEGSFGLKTLANQAGGVALVQLLGPWESDPQPGERLRLVDAKSGAQRDHVVDAPLVQRYRARLGTLVDGLAEEARRLGMRYAQVVGGRDLEGQARDELVRAGVLEMGLR